MYSTSVQFYSTNLAAQSAMSFVCPDIIIACKCYWPTHCVLVLGGQTALGHHYLQYTVGPQLSEHFNVKDIHISEIVWISELSDKYTIDLASYI